MGGSVASALQPVRETSCMWCLRLWSWQSDGVPKGLARMTDSAQSGVLRELVYKSGLRYVC